MGRDTNTRKARLRLLAALVAAATAVVIGMSGANSPVVAASGVTTVTIDGSSHTVDGQDVYRSANFLVMYTPAYGASTRTNQYGFEAAVVNGKVTQIADGVGNMAIPAGGYVLSGHGTSRTWLKARAQVGDTVSINGNTGGGTPLLPDVGMRTLRLFSIAFPTSGQFAGKKLLKFPAVTANIGDGPLEIRGVRSTSSSTDWVGTQFVRNTDGSTTTLPPSPSATFVFGGDGHNHWHIKDFDSYELLNSSGTVLEVGEKHGFCFEDNTSYRNWPGSSAHPASPANPVYVPPAVCSVGQPQATNILHGLSVGWSDTYPATLPDQAIDITGIPNGDYTVKVTADWQHLWAETNENNNSATAKIRINGSSVTLLSATDGL